MLPGLATARFRTTYILLNNFMRFGYAPVIPPMLEYTSSMFTNVTAEEQANYFQLKDVHDGHMLALRADITPQIARIAQTALMQQPRPLRLCYAAPRIRVTAEALQTRREHLQIGLEFIGATGIEAEAEVIAIAQSALQALGLNDLSLDIHLPALTQQLIHNQPAAQHAALYAAIRHKDAEQLQALRADDLSQLLTAHGSYSHCINTLKNTDSAILSQATQTLKEMAAAIQAKGCTLPVTVDALDVEHGGAYSGISFSIFSRNPAFEVARGGRYLLQNGEQAVGFTLYLEEVLANLPAEPSKPIIAVFTDTALDAVETLQDQGYITIYMQPEQNDAATLKKCGATYIYRNNKIETV